MTNRILLALRLNQKRTHRTLVFIFFLLIGITSFRILNISKPISVATVEKLSQSDYESEKDQLIRRLETSGIQSSFDYVRERIKVNPAFARDCHPLLHDLGHAAFAHYGSFSAAMAQTDEICNSGFMHGVIEANFEETTDVSEALNTSCPKASQENFHEWQCFHGIGHGAMYATTKNLTKSLEICKNLSTTFAVSSCVNGVFMEKFIIVGHDGERASNIQETNLSLCKEQNPEHKSSCYLYAPTAYLETHTNQYLIAIDWCKQSEQTYIHMCISGVGAQAMKENIKNPSISALLCKKVSPQYQKDCAYGAIDIFINYHASSYAAEPLCSKQFSAFKQTCQTLVKNKRSSLKI